VTSPNKHSRLAVLAVLMLAAFVAQLPVASSQEAPAPAPSAAGALGPVAAALADPNVSANAKAALADPKISDEAKAALLDPEIGAQTTPSLVDPNFDPRAPGTDSPGVLTGRAATKGYRCLGYAATIVGTPHNDRIYGTKKIDVIVGLGGNDIISSGEAADIVCGSGGDDQIYSLAANDRVDGGEGNDTVYAGDGDDRVWGNAGDDTINGEGGTDYLYGDAGNDTIYGGGAGGAPPVNPVASQGPSPRGIPGDSNNMIYGGVGDDTLNGAEGNDNIYGQAGNDTVFGAEGNDRVQGGPDRDVVFAGDGDDVVSGAFGDDIINGEAGSDTLWGDSGKDALYGGAGNDTLRGGDDSDLLDGEAGNDTLFGDGGGDILCGGSESDTLFGGEQDDLISGEGDCAWAGGATATIFTQDLSTPTNLIDGGLGFDTCVSQSMVLSPQTVYCEAAGIYYLEVKVTGTGGYVTGLPVDMFNESVIDCDSTGGTCKIYYLPGTDVTLTAHETTGEFFQWSGAISGCGAFTPTDLQCEFMMNQNRSVTAEFVTPAPLTVVVTGPSTVTSSDAFINCTNAAGPGCSHSYPTGGTVSLSATNTVNSWVLSANVGVQSGCTALSPACTVKMNGTGTVTVASAP